MPAVNAAPSKPRKAARKATRKAATAKTSTARSRSTKARSTKAKSVRAKAARTRATHQSEAAVRQAQTATRDTADVFGDYAERAVLIPVGAALVARDRVVTSVSDTLSTYSSTSKAQAQLRRFERRGATARNRLEREVRKARVRVERQLRQRRRVVEKTVKERRRDFEKSVNDLESRRDAISNRVPELANRAQERILSLV
ncbi:MAG TPA: hypothetical protein VNY34_01040 [Solirubrobacteraceae bacterium]|jgi:hypothetical protein|nr:hypothetical protein [Solirubrobacteraceae bacterium]